MRFGQEFVDLMRSDAPEVEKLRAIVDVQAEMIYASKKRLDNQTQNYAKSVTKTRARKRGLYLMGERLRAWHRWAEHKPTCPGTRGETCTCELAALLAPLEKY